MHHRPRATLLVAVLAMFATDASALDPSTLDRVTFANRTGIDIVYLYFSPGDSDHWGADVLGATERLLHGEDVGFYLHHPNRADEFDFLAIDENENAYLMWDVHVTHGEAPVIEITPAQLEGGYDFPPIATVRFTNETGYDMWFAFFSPGDSAMLGIDMLGNDAILENEETLSLAVPVTDEPVRYDFVGVDVDEDSYRFQTELTARQLDYTFSIELSHLR
jgi:hypothetical protein